MAKKAQFKFQDVVHWLDVSAIQFAKYFGTYNFDEPESFKLAPAYSLVPQFLYNLRHCLPLLRFKNLQEQQQKIDMAVHEAAETAA